MRQLRETSVKKQTETNTPKCASFAYGCIAFMLSGLFTFTAYADDLTDRRYTAAQKISASLDDVEINKDYALGVNRFDLDHRTEIIGWQLANSWYLGRQDGLDSGLTLVWHQSRNQVSVSKDGVRLTRRF